MIVDAHLDIAYNALEFGRGFDGPLDRHHLVSRGALEKAGVRLVFATIYVPPASRDPHREAKAQINYYRTLRPFPHVLLMEGADPIDRPQQLSEWQRLGVRIIGPAWADTRYSKKLLTRLGRELLKEMARLGLVLDLSHMRDGAVAEALATYEGPIIASHSNSRQLVPAERQLPAATVRKLAERKGVVGVSFFRKHLRADDRRATLDDVVNHVRAHAEAAGSPRHVGIGSDLDGGFAKEDAPIRSYDQMTGLADKLARHMSDADVSGVLGGNWRRFLRVKPARTSASIGAG